MNEQAKIIHSQSNLMSFNLNCKFWTSKNIYENPSVLNLSTTSHKENITRENKWYVCGYLLTVIQWTTKVSNFPRYEQIKHQCNGTAGTTTVAPATAATKRALALAGLHTGMEVHFFGLSVVLLPVLLHPHAQLLHLPLPPHLHPEPLAPKHR